MAHFNLKGLERTVSFNREKKRCLNVHCSRLAVFIYDPRAVIRALIYTRAEEQKEKQEESKLHDAVWRIIEPVGP
ncbi:hypothetical protein EXN66_Car021239 [Channa argus]|uniref:Uncharacterized protein n=1 Tax=Channa argus TaxID=215402 RepID=A0A6G1QTK7_CHAAH|nr:hypothetical protein EXN66_Car021239 [Channa argus]